MTVDDVVEIVTICQHLGNNCRQAATLYTAEKHFDWNILMSGLWFTQGYCLGICTTAWLIYGCDEPAYNASCDLVPTPLQLVHMSYTCY